MKEPTPPLRIQHHLSDYAYWTLFLLVPVVTASAAILLQSFIWFAIYAAVIVIAFVGLWYRFFCPRCPYYKKRGSLCKCMFIWGLPKVYRLKDGPYRKNELYLAFAGLILIYVFPVYWLIQVPSFLVVYFLSLALFVISIYRYECIRCIHFYCPLNRTQKKQ